MYRCKQHYRRRARLRLGKEAKKSKCKAKVKLAAHIGKNKRGFG